MKRLVVILERILLALILVATVALVAADTTVDAQLPTEPPEYNYPVLDSNLTYFRTDFPSGLRYSPAWYGTFTHAPQIKDILLFDDEQGIVLFAMDNTSDLPYGAQGGTTLRQISFNEANTLIRSYGIDESVKPFDNEIIEVFEFEDFYNGVWMGEKLSQKEQADFLLESERLKKLQRQEQIALLLEKAEKEPLTEAEEKALAELLKAEILTERQQKFREDREWARENKIPFDYALYDPNRHWVGDGGNWSDNTNHWSAASGGAPGASLPTSADSTFFDANSFTVGAQTVTIDANAYCLDLDWTGQDDNPTLSGGNDLYVYGSLTFIAAMVLPYTGAINFNGNAVARTVTAGLAWSSHVVFNGNGGDWILQDTLTTTGNIAFIRTALDTNDQTVTCSLFDIDGTFVRTLDLGASTINCSNLDADVATNLTLTEGTSTIKVAGTGYFYGGDETYNNVELNGTSHTVSGSNTFATLTRTGTATKTDTVTFTSGTTQTMTTLAMIGNSATNRLLMQSSAVGTAATVTATNWVGTANVDIMDITATNAIDLSAIAGLSGDAQGNTNITFTTADIMYWHVDGGSWSTAGMWFLASNGLGGGGRVPLPQDDAVFDANSFDNGGQTVTCDMPRWGNDLGFTGVTNTPTILSAYNGSMIFGSLTLVSGLTYTHGNDVLDFMGRSPLTVTSAGKVFYRFRMRGPGGTLTLQDGLTSDEYVQAIAGTLDFNDNAVTTGYFTSYSCIPGTTLTMGSGIFTLNHTTIATKWNGQGNLTVNAETSTIVFTNTGATATIFQGRGRTFNDFTIEGAGNYATAIASSNTFNTLTVDRSVAAKTLRVTDGTTQTVTDFVCAESGVTLLTITDTAGAGATLAKAGGGAVELDYLDLSNNTGTPLNTTWYYGFNSVIGAGVIGWVAGVPVVPMPSYDVYRSNRMSITPNGMLSLDIEWPGFSIIAANGTVIDVTEYMLQVDSGEWPTSYRSGATVYSGSGLSTTDILGGLRSNARYTLFYRDLDGIWVPACRAHN